MQRYYNRNEGEKGKFCHSSQHESSRDEVSCPHPLGGCSWGFIYFWSTIVVQKVINFNHSLSLCCADTASVGWNIFCLHSVHFSDLQIASRQVLYVESVNFLMFLVAYDTVSLHQADEIFIICIFLSAIIPNVNIAGPQQEQEQAPQQGQRQATEWTNTWTRGSSRTMPITLNLQW